jgi:hypothetical protein
LQKVAGFAYVTQWAHLAESKADGGVVRRLKTECFDAHIEIFAEKELDDSVVKCYLTTAADGENYKVAI